MLRQFVGTKLALICDPILRCLYLNRSNFQLLVNLVEMDEFWLYCSFYSGNDFSSAVPYQCFMRSTPLRRTVISLFGSAVNTLRARRRSFSLKSSTGCLSLAFAIFTFNLGFKICWNILYNNPVQSNFFLAPGCFLHTAVAPTLFEVTGLPRMSEAHYWIFPPLVNLQWSGLTDNVSFTLTPMARWGQVKLASNYSVVPFNEQQY